MVLNHRQGCLPLTTPLNPCQTVVPSVGVDSLAFFARGDGRSVDLSTGDDAFSCDHATDYCPLSGQRALTRQVLQCLPLLPSISNPLLWFSDPDHGVSGCPPRFGIGGAILVGLDLLITRVEKLDELHRLIRWLIRSRRGLSPVWRRAGRGVLK